jgi:hypothetical protein
VNTIASFRLPSELLRVDLMGICCRASSDEVESRYAVRGNLHLSPQGPRRGEIPRAAGPTGATRSSIVEHGPDEALTTPALPNFSIRLSEIG